jgi:hypothetical protein
MTVNGVTVDRLNSLIPDLLDFAALSNQPPFAVLHDALALADGGLGDPETADALLSAYLWDHRHELPWLIAPPRHHST